MVMHHWYVIGFISMLFADIGGTTGQMLEQNAQVFNQISANLAAFQVTA